MPRKFSVYLVFSPYCTKLCVILVSIKIVLMEADVRRDKAVLFNVAKKNSAMRIPILRVERIRYF